MDTPESRSSSPQPFEDNAARETQIAESLRDLVVSPAPVGFPEDALKGTVRAQYVRNYWPVNRHAPQILPADLQVSTAEAAEYWTYCLGETITPAQVSEAHCWQFSARKSELFLDETIPRSEKNERSRTLTAWHPIACKYSPNGYEYRDEWFKNLTRRCIEFTAFQIEFVQPLALGEVPKPVPGAVLAAIRDGLQQHLQAQEAVLHKLRQQSLPLWVQAGKEMKLLWPSEICFITSEAQVGLDVFTVSGERWPCFESLAVLEQRFASEPHFMRTSRQHLVNLHQVDRIQPAGRGRNLSFRGLAPDLQARVTDTYLKAFLERLSGAVPGPSQG